MKLKKIHNESASSAKKPRKPGRWKRKAEFAVGNACTTRKWRSDILFRSKELIEANKDADPKVTLAYESWITVVQACKNGGMTTEKVFHSTCLFIDFLEDYAPHIVEEAKCIVEKKTKQAPNPVFGILQLLG